MLTSLLPQSRLYTKAILFTTTVKNQNKPFKHVRFIQSYIDRSIVITFDVLLSYKYVIHLKIKVIHRKSNILSYRKDTPIMSSRLRFDTQHFTTSWKIHG